MVINIIITRNKNKQVVLDSPLSISPNPFKGQCKHFYDNFPVGIQNWPFM